MKSSTVNISFSDDLLRKIDQVARDESRSRSELIREAARGGDIDRKHRWKQIFDFSKMKAAKKGIGGSVMGSDQTKCLKLGRNL
jgi:metal-responsive CopG/Arc/MetJ family transcriptional regulator